MFGRICSKLLVTEKKVNRQMGNKSVANLKENVNVDFYFTQKLGKVELYHLYYYTGRIKT